MTHTDRATVLALAIKNLLKTNASDLDIDSVLYGDHNNLPTGMAVTIQPARKNRELEGVAGPGGRTMNFMRILVTLYNSRVGSEEEQRLTVDLTSESIESLLHSDTTMGGIIIHGFVEEIENGVVVRDGSMFRTVVLTYVGKTKTNLTL